MTLDLVRVVSNATTTIGMLFINGLPECWVIEDSYREHKVKHKTRIPKGVYQIGRRYYGRLHQKYAQRFDFHDGMLEVLDVPNFTDILIHIGNTDSDTSGCLLVATGALIRGHKDFVGVSSTIAYEHIYKLIIAAINAGEIVTLTIHDDDRTRKLNA